MLRKIFTFVSFFIATIYLVVSVSNNSDKINFGKYDTVDVLYTKEGYRVDKSVIFTALDEFANEQDSLIGFRVLDTGNNSNKKFKYILFGKGEIPSGMTEANESDENRTNLSNSYLILSGALTKEKLKDFLDGLGLQAYSQSKKLLVSQLFTVSVNEISAVLVVIMSVAFFAITLIERIKDLKNSSIQFISGKYYLSILFKPFITDVVVVSALMVLHMIFSSILLSILKVFTIYNLLLVSLGLLIIGIIFIFISFLLLSIYLVSLRKSNLKDLVKGKLPLKRMLSVILSTQFIAVITVGGMALVSIYYANLYHNYQQIEQKWQKHNELWHVEPGFGTLNGSDEEARQKSNKVYDMLLDIPNSTYMLVKHNLRRYDSGNVDIDGNSRYEYNPTGNTLIVTPNYFETQQYSLTDNVDFSVFNQLSLGEFGLILPEKLENKKDEIVMLYETFMTDFSADDEEMKNLIYKAKAITYFSKNNQDLFIFNTAHDHVKDAYLKDPIIIILTPQSTGDTYMSKDFWYGEFLNHMHFSDIRTIQNKLEKFDVYQYLSNVKNGHDSYRWFVSDLQNNLIVLFVATISGVIITFVLFNLMNMIYFEQFRKEILIKQLSGVSFYNIHKYFLLIQINIILLATFILYYITRQIYIVPLMLSIFSSAMWLSIKHQLTKEKQNISAVLKGQ